MCGGCGPFLPCITVTHATTLAVTAEEDTVTNLLQAVDHHESQLSHTRLMCDVMAVCTFSCVVSQDRARSHLLALCVLSGAGVWAVRPGGPGTQRAVLGTRHLTDDRHGQNGVAAQLLFHISSWMDRSAFHYWEKLIPDLNTQTEHAELNCFFIISIMLNDCSYKFTD